MRAGQQAEAASTSGRPTDGADQRRHWHSLRCGTRGALTAAWHPSNALLHSTANKLQQCGGEELRAKAKNTHRPDGHLPDSVQSIRVTSQRLTSTRRSSSRSI